MLQEREVFDKKSGELLATVDSLSFARGDGGFSESGDNGRQAKKCVFSARKVPIACEMR